MRFWEKDSLVAHKRSYFKFVRLTSIRNLRRTYELSSKNIFFMPSTFIWKSCTWHVAISSLMSVFLYYFSILLLFVERLCKRNFLDIGQYLRYWNENNCIRLRCYCYENFATRKVSLQQFGTKLSFFLIHHYRYIKH